MKNAPNRMIGWPTKGDMVARKPLTDQEEKFCELVINGMKQTDALISSGIMPADSEFKVLKNKAGSLMATARVRRYMIENAKVIKVMTSRDYDIVRTHMYEIAMGTAVRNVLACWGGYNTVWYLVQTTPLSSWHSLYIKPVAISMLNFKNKFLRIQKKGVCQ